MIKGIDVSALNGNINWAAVAKSGVKFAMIKASQGRGETAATKNLTFFKDSAFDRNIKGAAAAGIKCGVYHYLTAATVAEAKREADQFIGVISPYKSQIELWAAVDVESDKYLPTSKSLLTNIVEAFMARVEAAGYRPMLYTNPNYLTYRYTAHAFDDTEIWLAHYGVTKPMDMPKLRIWQMKSVGNESDVAYGYATVAEGRIAGINASVDIDMGYFELAAQTASADGYKVGGKYTIKAGDVYSNGSAVPARLVGKEYTIAQITNGKILLGEIMSWIKV